MNTNREPSTGKRELVRAYFASLPPEARRRMKQMRGLILEVAPDATETFSYRIPGFRLDGRVFVYYAAFTSHTSLYPMGAAIRRVHDAKLRGLKTSTGTIQFPLDQPLNAALVRSLVKARKREVRGGSAKRSA